MLLSKETQLIRNLKSASIDRIPALDIPSAATYANA